MKTSHIFAAAGLACSLLCISIRYALADSDAEVVIPPFEQLQQISISASKGWRLVIRPDGSGKLAYGSGPLDVGNIPTGLLDARKFYNAVVPTLRSTPYISNSATVALRRVGEVSVNALYTNNEAAVTEILLAAKSHAKAFDKDRFEQLLRERPLLPQSP